MDAGTLDRRITLLRAVAFDGDLEPEVVWTPLAEVWAAFAPVRDDERVRAAAVGATLTARFTIRWAPDWADLSPADRLTFDGALYGISAVKEVGRREGLEITATAHAPQAAGIGGGA